MPGKNVSIDTPQKRDLILSKENERVSVHYRLLLHKETYGYSSMALLQNTSSRLGGKEFLLLTSKEEQTMES